MFANPFFMPVNKFIHRQRLLDQKSTTKTSHFVDIEQISFTIFRNY
ncbi:hypothetical protein tloyanaT_03760 [Thalassotalea loyana]|uniref:Uncharacterized protein n=1 Tax=Thalassotalea loyana TaxID=280483 RepID=A0ABQ6H9I5_9GAMM|nr:hypothetical protein tloyanaT_03760 [Thalassotalea loyana]